MAGVSFVLPGSGLLLLARGEASAFKTVGVSRLTLPLAVVTAADPHPEIVPKTTKSGVRPRQLTLRGHSMVTDVGVGWVWGRDKLVRAAQGQFGNSLGAYFA